MEKTAYLDSSETNPKARPCSVGGSASSIWDCLSRIRMEMAKQIITPIKQTRPRDRMSRNRQSCSRRMSGLATGALSSCNIGI